MPWCARTRLESQLMPAALVWFQRGSGTLWHVFLALTQNTWWHEVSQADSFVIFGGHDDLCIFLQNDDLLGTHQNTRQILLNCRLAEIVLCNTLIFFFNTWCHKQVLHIFFIIHMIYSHNNAMIGIFKWKSIHFHLLVFLVEFWRYSIT